jgi:nucleotidyltransferase/DNA polymerase involved in DNA repair
LLCTQGAPLPAASSRPATEQQQQQQQQQQRQQQPQQQFSMQPGLDLPLSRMAEYVQQGLALGQAPSAAAAASCQDPGAVLDQQPGLTATAATAWDLRAAVAVAQAIRSTVEATLGLTVSVGVAPNRFLAKLSSRAAKPDGVCCIDSIAAVQALLQGASVNRLPGARVDL